MIVGHQVGIEVGDKSIFSGIGKFCSAGDQRLIDDENDFEILEGLRVEALHDIVHIVVSPRRDDDA